MDITVECKISSREGILVAAVSFGGTGISDEATEIPVSAYSKKHGGKTPSSNYEGPHELPRVSSRYHADMGTTIEEMPLKVTPVDIFDETSN